MNAPVNIFAADLDSRDADEVLLMRMKVLADPESAPVDRYIFLVLSIIKAKLTYVLEEARQGQGVDDDELFDASLWLHEAVADLGITNRDLIELFRAAILDRVAQEEAQRGGPKPPAYKPKWKPQTNRTTSRKSKRSAETTALAEMA